MALFNIKRFMGEEGDNFGQNSASNSESILKKLHEKAKAREIERQSHDKSHDKSHDESHTESHTESHGGSIFEKSTNGSTLSKSAKKGKRSQSSREANNLGNDRKRELSTRLSVKKIKTGHDGVVAESGSGKNKVTEKKAKKLEELEESKLQSQKSDEDNSPKSDKVSTGSDFKRSKLHVVATPEMAWKKAKETQNDLVESPVRLIKNESSLKKSSLRAFREKKKNAKKQENVKLPTLASKLKSARINGDSNRTVDNRTHESEDFKEDDAVMVTRETPLKSSKACPESTRSTLTNAEETSPQTQQKRKRKVSVTNSDVKSERRGKISARSCDEKKKEDANVVSGDHDTSDQFDGSDESDDENEDYTRALPVPNCIDVFEDDSTSHEGSDIDDKQDEMDFEVDDERQESRDFKTEEEMASLGDVADEDREEEGTVKEAEDGDDLDKGFALLGSDKPRKKKRISRVLPNWLAHPTLIEHNLKKYSIAVEKMKQLDPRLVKSLSDEGITSLFPVQRHVIPVILDSVKLGIHAGDAGYRPRDLCVSAPTGSGKTLAFALPIVQALLDRVVPRIRALVVLPTRDLAQQVSKVFNALCKGTDLRTSLIGGLKKFSQEQRMLVQTSGGETQCDIVVATPGRLVDHINKTQGFTLQSLRFLVIDEADRMMEQISKDWINQVEKCVFAGNRLAPGLITVETCRKISLPLQKLLFSATLSQNPEKLIQLNLFQPRLITSVVSSAKSRQEAQRHDGNGQARGEFVGKFTTPVGLTEFYVQCTPGEKPLVVLHLIQTLNLGQILCFANTVEATHRLYHLMKLVGGIEVAEFSSNLTTGQRRQILRQFKTSKIQLLICSDAMARGMDVENAKYVISYDMPPYIKTYIHRVGRTARAGKTGTAFSLLQQYEVPKLLKLLKHAGKTSIQQYSVNRQDMDPLVETYEKALQRLPAVLEMEKAHSF